MIRFKNNTNGWYSIVLQDFNGIRPNKEFIFPNAASELTIPVEYAQSIPSIPYAVEAYKLGYFVVTQGQEEFDKYFVEEGSVTEEEIKKVKENVVPDAILKAALTDGKVAKVKEYINSPNLERLTSIAIENIDKISGEKIKLIEQATGVSLVIEDE